jgi:pimeloyl-ACP methyl ester carboxylesterase
LSRAPAVATPLLRFVPGRVAAKLERLLDRPEEAALKLFEGAARDAQVAAVADYARSGTPEALRAEIADYVAAARSTRAVLADIAALVRPWPFELAALETHVEIWHGLDDPAAPAGAARALAAVLPDSRAQLFPGEGTSSSTPTAER